MAQNTHIEWTDHTVNYWWGCTKVGPGCDHCYAETMDKRLGGNHWGPRAPRKWIRGAGEALRRINHTAPAFHEKHARWPRVFLQSMSDLFDNEVPEDWQTEALVGIALAQRVRAQLLTKRIGNVEAAWAKVGVHWPEHVGLMITVCNQAEAARDIPKLIHLKSLLGIPWVGLSVEPMLGPVDLIEATRQSLRHPSYLNLNLDWVICGGESGPHARPMHPDWALFLRDQCQAAGVPFLFKQWGEWAPGAVAGPNERSIDAAVWFDDQWDFFRVGKAKPDDHADDEPDMFRVGKRAAGRHLDGRTWDQFPLALDGWNGI